MKTKEQRLHISEIDEFLAHRLAAGHRRPFKLALTRNGDQGYLKVCMGEYHGLIEGDGVDFDLSPGENKDLDDFDASYFIMKPVYTSSAYELFDYIIAYFHSIECIVDFKENAWLVKVLRAD